MIEILGYIGFFLLFPGTMAAYIAYAVINGEKDYGDHDGPMPLYSNMFRFWPLVGNLTFSLGTTLLCTGLLVHISLVGGQLSKLFLFATTFTVTCAMGVVASAEDYGYELIYVCHNLFTGGFVIGAFVTFSILVRYNMRDMIEGFEWVYKFMWVLKFFMLVFGLLAIGSGIALFQNSPEKHDELHSSARQEDRRVPLQILASSEFLLLLTYGIGYSILAFGGFLFLDKYEDFPDRLWFWFC